MDYASQDLARYMCLATQRGNDENISKVLSQEANNTRISSRGLLEMPNHQGNVRNVLASASLAAME